MLVGLLLTGTACAGDVTSVYGSGEPEPIPPQRGGSVVVGTDQEPRSLNILTRQGSDRWTRIMVDPALSGAYSAGPDLTYKPDLLDGEPEVTRRPFSILYHIKKEATWSDGEPVTAADFEFTWRAVTFPGFPAASHAGYGAIRRARVIDDKTILFIFKRPFAAYKTLFDPVLPKHVLEFEDLSEVWNDCICDPKSGAPIASGPFIVDSWEKGSHLTIERNKEYWGPRTSYLDSIVFRFATDCQTSSVPAPVATPSPGDSPDLPIEASPDDSTLSPSPPLVVPTPALSTCSDTQADMLVSGRFDVIYPQPQPNLKELRPLPNIDLQSSPGAQWSALVLSESSPLVRPPWLRQALAYGIDRRGLARALAAPLDAESTALESAVFLPGQAGFEAHFDIYNYDPEKAISILDGNGCTLGSDSIYSCGGRKMMLRYAPAEDDSLAQLQLELLRPQLARIGIGVVAAGPGAPGRPGSLSAADQEWDVAGVVFTGGADPHAAVPRWGCEGRFNYGGYCSEKVTDLLNRSVSEIDPLRRTATLNRVDDLLASDLPVLPLYRRPTVLAFYHRLRNVEDNIGPEGPLWNAVSWWLEP